MDEQTTTEAPATTEGAEEAQPSQVTDSAAATTAEPTQPQAGTEPSEDDNLAWLAKKGIDPDSPEAISKLAEQYRNAEKLMHQSTAKASELEKALTNGDAPEADYSGVPREVLENPFVKTLMERLDDIEGKQTVLTLEQKVGNFFAANPDARPLEGKMTELVTTRPELNQLVRQGYLSLEDLHAIAASTPEALDQAKKEGGREALQQVASKQQAKAVPGIATNSDLGTGPEDGFLSGLLGK
jgi:hypothetical protein